MRSLLSCTRPVSVDPERGPIIRTIFAQPDSEHIQKQFGEVTTMLARSHPKVAAMLTDAQPDLLRLADSVLIEQHDEWEAGDRRYFSEASMLELKTMNNPLEVIDEAPPEAPRTQRRLN